MPYRFDDSIPWERMRFRVTTDGDPSVLPRVLGLFQNLNITPARVSADVGIRGLMHLAIDFCGLPEERASLMAAKVAETPCVLNAYWHYV